MRTAIIAIAAAMLATACANWNGLVRPSRLELVLHPFAGKLRYLETTSPAGARLLFDTGGGLTLLSPTIAAAVGCVPYTRLTSLRMNGERFDVESCGPSRLVFGSLTVNADTGLFDLMSLLPTGLPKLDGLASLQTFAGQVVTLDLAGNRLCVDSAVDSSKIREMVPLPIRIAHSAGGAGLDVFIRIEGSSGPLWFELDSANLDNVLIADRVLGQLGLSQPQLESLRDHQPTPIALRIGALGPLNVTATGRDLIYDGALNADTLERLIVVLDLKAASGWVSLRSESS